MKTISFRMSILIWSYMLILTACQKDKAMHEAQTNNDQPGHIPGMGSTEGALSGQPFVLSESIEIKGGIGGDLFLAPANDYCLINGSGAFVLVTMEFVNHFDQDTLLVLPAGLTFTADNPSDQNGVLIQETPIPLRKGKSCKVLLYLYCLNEHRTGSSKSSTYTFGPITDAAPVKELIQLLKDKQINYAHLDTEVFLEIKHDLQHIVWKITDHEGIDQQDLDYIKTLPNRPLRT